MSFCGKKRRVYANVKIQMCFSCDGAWSRGRAGWHSTQEKREKDGD